MWHVIEEGLTALCFLALMIFALYLEQLIG